MNISYTKQKDKFTVEMKIANSYCAGRENWVCKEVCHGWVFSKLPNKLILTEDNENVEFDYSYSNLVTVSALTNLIDKTSLQL